MVEATLQAIALCAYGTAYLHGTLDDERLSGLAKLPIFHNVVAFEFDRGVPGYKGSEFATLPTAWLRRLKREDGIGLTLCFDQFDWTAAPYAPRDGKGIGLICDAGFGLEVWPPNWTFRTSSRGDSGWKVSYESTRAQRTYGLERPTIDQLRKDWRHAVAQLIGFFDGDASSTWSKRLFALLTLDGANAGPMETQLCAIPDGFVESKELVAVGNVLRTELMLTSSDYVRTLAELNDEDLNARTKEVWTATLSLLGQALNQAGESRSKAA